MARHLARIDQAERAIRMLSDAIDRGFLCATSISRDPWFSALRSCPDYHVLMVNARLRSSEAHAAFLAAGGQELIAVP